MDYVESRLPLRRRIGLMLHALRCARCRRDLVSWPAMRRMVRQSERCLGSRGHGMAAVGTGRIRC